MMVKLMPSKTLKLRDHSPRLSTGSASGNAEAYHPRVTGEGRSSFSPLPAVGMNGQQVEPFGSVPSALGLNQLSFEFGQEIPSTWDFGKDVLDGFEQFMDTTPNLDPAVSYGAQRAPVHTTSRASSDDVSDTHLEHTSRGRVSAERKQQNNRAAQKRFRQRQVLSFS